MEEKVVLFNSIDTYRVELRTAEERAEEWRALEESKAPYRRELAYHEHVAADERRTIEESKATYACDLLYRKHCTAYTTVRSDHDEAWDDMQVDLDDEEEVAAPGGAAFPAVTAGANDVVIISSGFDKEA